MKTVTIHPFADIGSRYTMVDNYLFDHIMPNIKPNSWKVISLIIRKTTGWHKKADQLSYSQIRAGTGIASQSTIQAALKELLDRTLIIQVEGPTKWEAFTYSLNYDFTATIPVTDETEPSTEIVTEPSTEIVTEPSTEIVNTKERSKDSLKKKASSANADYISPVSLLSADEIKALKLPLSSWTQYLEDEQAERNRSGVIKFIKAKLAIYPLLPDSPAATILFEKLAVEAEAKGRRPPNKFPTLAAKEKFNLAAANLNGTLETAINSGLAAGITAIPKLINYISSPKWRNDNGQKRPGTRQPAAYSNQSSQRNKFAPAAGAGQSPEMAAKLRAAFAPK